MVDWKNIVTVEQNGFSLVKVSHFFAGLIFYEYVTNFDYELAFYRGKRPWRWTLLIYSGARLSTLFAFIMILVALSPPSGIYCKGITVAVFFFAYAGFSLSGLLVIVRTVALWERRPVVMAFLGGVMLATVSVELYSLSRYDSGYSLLLNTCFVINSYEARWAPFMLIVGDMVYLAFMLVGVLRRKSSSSLWSVLYTQGIISIAVITIIGIPPLTLAFLNLNDNMNIIFQVPAVVVWTILVSRLYRSLDAFSHSPSSGGPFGTSYLRDNALGTTFDLGTRVNRTRRTANGLPPSATYVGSTANIMTIERNDSEPSFKTSLEVHPNESAMSLQQLAYEKAHRSTPVEARRALQRQVSFHDSLVGQASGAPIPSDAAASTIAQPVPSHSPMPAHHIPSSSQSPEQAGAPDVATSQPSEPTDMSRPERAYDGSERPRVRKLPDPAAVRLSMALDGH